MKYIRLTLVFALILSFFNAPAQSVQQQLDSLIVALPKAKEDTNKVLLLCAISINYFQNNPNEGIVYGLQGLKLATKLDYTYGVMKANSTTARCYAIQNMYAEALKYFQDALVAARKMNSHYIIGAQLVSLGAIYTNKEEYGKALNYLEEARNEYRRGGIKNTASLMINIGHLHSKQGNTALALKVYMEGIDQEEEKEQPTGELATLYSNAGGMYLLQQDHVHALGFLFKALQIQQYLGNEKSAAFTLNNIGEAYFELTKAADNNKPDSLKNKRAIREKAIYYLNQSITISQNLGIKNLLVLSYQNLAAIYKIQEDYKKSLEYYSLYMSVMDSLTDINKEKEFARIEAEFFTRKKTDSLKFANTLKDEELKQRKLERNGSVVLVLLTGAMSILFINRQNITRKKLKAEKELADSKLNSAQQRLYNFTESMREKNKLIESFSAEIERLQALPCSNELPDSKDNLTKLQSSIILTDKQWVNFKELFDQVHVGFLERLREKLPELTPAETRYLALCKLKLNNKEMANMLGIGLSGMRNYKYRLTKKIDLPDDTDLDQLVESI